MSNATLQATCHKALVKDLKALVTLDGKRADILRSIAEDIVRLRGTFTKDGRPDWSAKNQETREAVSKAFAEAGLESISIQSSLRNYYPEAYGKIVPEDDRKTLGLNTAGPAEKARNKTAKAKAATAAAASGTTWQVPEEVRAIGTAMAASVTTKDPTACVQVMQAMLKDARTYDVPEDPTGLLMMLSALTAEIDTWAEEINTRITERTDSKDAHKKEAVAS